ncbi:hypothetical protein BD410DRAFT_796757 [Rickenella mellea]|uniref:Uncharacterized protein n=1 Tax=Rickenella mellea TaxID=50990 RepID=A0A4Y7PJ43_9AGAM|nr:hypothetical protein BD410DRAFT_796757 [Rickenella mellea]
MDTKRVHRYIRLTKASGRRRLRNEPFNLVDSFVDSIETSELAVGVGETMLDTLEVTIYLAQKMEKNGSLTYRWTQVKHLLVSHTRPQLCTMRWEKRCQHKGMIEGYTRGYIPWVALFVLEASKVASLIAVFKFFFRSSSWCGCGIVAVGTGRARRGGIRMHGVADAATAQDTPASLVELGNIGVSFKATDTKLVERVENALGECGMKLTTPPTRTGTKELGAGREFGSERRAYLFRNRRGDYQYDGSGLRKS